MLESPEYEEEAAKVKHGKVHGVCIVLFLCSLLIWIPYMLLNNFLYQDHRMAQKWVTDFVMLIGLFGPGTFLLLSTIFNKSGVSTLVGVISGIIVIIVGAFMFLLISELRPKWITLENGYIRKESVILADTPYNYKYYEKDTWYSQRDITAEYYSN